MQQAITKDVALLALRIAGSIRRDEFYDLDDLTDYVNGFIDDYIDQEGLRLSKDELYQLRQEVVRMAKRRNTEIVESQWEEDDLDQVINNAIEDVSERLTVGRRKSGVARDPYGVSNDPQVVNAAINAERRQQEQTQRVVNPQPVGNGNTPKISQPAQTNPADAPDSNLDDRKKAAIQEKLRRYETQLSNKQPLNPDQTTSYLNRLRQLRGFGAAKQAWDNDADGLLDGDGGDRFFKEHDQRRRQQQPTPAQTQPQSQTATNRLNKQDVERMAQDPSRIQAYRQEALRRQGTHRIADQEIAQAATTMLPYEQRQRVLESLRTLQKGQTTNTAVAAQTPNQGINPRLVVAPKQYSKREVQCNPAVSKPCGGTCIPKDHTCHEEAGQIEKVTARLEAVPAALKEAEKFGKAMGLPITDPNKPVEVAKAAAAFESQARQAMPFLGDDVWKGLSKATSVMIRASVVSTAVLGAWAAFKNASGAINPGFKRALDMAENDAMSGVQKMAGAALRPLTDPFEARMAKQESRLRSELGGIAQQSVRTQGGTGLRSAQTVEGIVAANQGMGWYANSQRNIDNQYADNFDGWLKASGMLATQPSRQAYGAIGGQRFAREFTGDVSNANASREQLIDRADRTTRSFADEVGSRMARLGKDPDALKVEDFMSLLPKRSLEKFNPATNSINARTNDPFRQAIATSMYNRYQIGRSPASQRRNLLEQQLDGANDRAKSELAGLNRFIQAAASLKPGSAAPDRRKAEGQQRERVVLALARARGYTGGTAGGAYGYLREKHAQLPKKPQRGDSQDRFDKKCGQSGIPDNRKCSKNTTPQEPELPGDLQLRTTDMSGELVQRRAGLRKKALQVCQAIADAIVRLADKADSALNAMIDTLLPKQFRDGAKRLVGKTKLGLTHFMLDRDNYQMVDVDPENNGVTYKSPDGTLTGLTSAGTKVIAMQTYPWGHSYSLDRPFYETVFTVNNTVDSSKAGAKPNKKEIVEMARNTEALFRKQVELIKEDSAIMVSAFGGDTKEASRTKLYQRIGFTPGEVGGRKSEQGTEMWTMVEAGKLRSINNTEYQKIFGVPRQDHWWRYDKKCGNSGIPDNAKCTKQTKSSVESKPSSTSKPGADSQAGPSVTGALTKLAGTAVLVGAAYYGPTLIANAAVRVGGIKADAKTKDFVNDPRFDPTKLEDKSGVKHLGGGLFGEVYLDDTNDVIYKKNRTTSEALDKTIAEDKFREIPFKYLDRPQAWLIMNTVKTAGQQNEAAATMIAGDLGVGPKLMGKQGDVVGMEFLRGYKTMDAVLASAKESNQNSDLEQQVRVKRLEQFGKLHAVGIAHNDTHLENTMVELDASGALKNVKLIDFGFASLDDWGKVQKEANAQLGEVLKGYSLGSSVLDKLNSGLQQAQSDSQRSRIIAQAYSEALLLTKTGKPKQPGAEAIKKDAAYRIDKKCGESGISAGETCTKATWGSSTSKSGLTTGKLITAAGAAAVGGLLLALGRTVMDIQSSGVPDDKVPPKKAPDGYYDTLEPGDLIYQTVDFMGANQAHYAVYAGKVGGRHKVFDTSTVKVGGADTSRMQLRDIEAAEANGSTSFQKAERVDGRTQGTTAKQLELVIAQLDGKEFQWNGFRHNCESLARAVAGDLPISTQSKNVSKLTQVLTENLIRAMAPKGYKKALTQKQVEQTVANAA